MGCKFKVQPSKTAFKFGVDRQQSLGSMTIRIPVPGDSLMLIKGDVVPVDVPFLAGLDVLDRFKLVADTVENKLECKLSDWSLPLARKLGLLYLEWGDVDKVFFTRQQLTRLHRGFHHPATRKLYGLLKRAKVENLDEDTLKLLQDIKNKCDTCQRFGPKAHRFRVAMPEENPIFGQELSVNLQWIDGDTILHMGDHATRFSATTFLDRNG